MHFIYRYALIALVIFCSNFNGFSQDQSSETKLVVGIIVDQMRPEYLYRFQNKFSDGGFKRLMNDGFV
ncbi:hypothetical protein LCGC14_0199030 [marine sediment metagenome]|uniref:Alkaline phosphatase family protein n=1 Tax=marine sediment metagenome TaxID=412755 RepID=A0A0F9XMD1_9ZZZZ|nr:hypothetical protein [Maribacter sp.]HDZ03923.1 hypothetical protein [Maribacter sp.]